MRDSEPEKSYLEELREAVRAEAYAEGKAEMLRYSVLSLGRQRFGKAASRKQKTQLRAVTDLAHLERIRDRLLDADSWQDLLATP
jgi:hypothetical protein